MTQSQNKDLLKDRLINVEKLFFQDDVYKFTLTSNILYITC